MARQGRQGLRHRPGQVDGHRLARQFLMRLQPNETYRADVRGIWSFESVRESALHRLMSHPAWPYLAPARRLAQPR